MGASVSRVVVVGSINVDYIVRLLRLPRRGETVTGGTLVTRDGGKGANQAVAAARFGARVRFIGAVGDDAAGRAAIRALTHEGVDTDDVAIIPETATGLAAVLVDDDGDNQIAVASGANHEIGADHVRAAFADRPLQAADAVLLSFELRDPPLVAAAQHAHSRGATVIVNPAPWRPLPRELLEVSPTLTPNAREALSLDGRGEADPTEAAVREAARRLSAATRAPVVVTMGADGALAVTDDRSISQRPPAVAAHDTTGAGDAFSGVLAAALAGGATFTEALRLATAAASLSTTRSGARTALADRDQVMAAVASMPPAADAPPVR